MLTLMGFGQTSLSGVSRGFMPPQLKTKQTQIEQASKKGLILVAIGDMNIDLEK
jgi:hypothetical protein